MLTIFVGAKKQNIGTADGKVMKTYPLLVKEGNKYSYLNDRIDFSEVKDIEICVKRWFLPCMTLRVKLTPELKKGILEFLRRYHAKTILCFNCYSFACLVSNVEQCNSFKFWRISWRAQRHSLFRQVGDVVLLQNLKAMCFHHAAIYMGFGLYISVYGGGGDLEVATLKDMQRDYDARDLSFVVPRR